MARSRISRPIVQALLGLIFLAWPPAVDHANAGASFLVQLEQALLPAVAPDSGGADLEARPDGWSDGEDSPDALAPSIIVCRSTGHGRGQGGGFGLQCPIGFAPLGALRATGPPGARLDLA